MLKIKNIFIIIFFLQLIQGCSVAEPISDQYEWVQEWLISTTCLPPCWEGIILGKTTLYDIDKMTVPEKYNLSFNGPNHIEPSSYYYSWDNTEKYDHTTAVFTPTRADGDMTIDYIQFNFDGTRDSVAISDVLLKFGEPDEIGLRTEMVRCVAILFYDDKKVWLELQGKDMNDYYLLDEKTKLGGWSYYLSEGARDKQLYLFTKPDQQIVPWQGYGKYPCKKNW